MHEFRTEFVGDPQDEGVWMPKSETVRGILKGLWMVCSAEASGVGSDCDCYPKAEFRFRRRCKSKDRIFRVRDFEGRGTANDERAEDDGGPGRGGLDLLGKYTLSDRTVTIYVDSCRKVVGRKYRSVDSLKGLIEVVLIHELAHLMTHRVYDLKYANEDDSSVHLWEYTAQCATYAYLSIHCEKDLEVFNQLSSRQPFIYRTWEGLRAVESVHSEILIADVVKSIFSALKKPVPEKSEIPLDTSPYDN
jgi:hypothetical protein